MLRLCLAAVYVVTLDLSAPEEALHGCWPRSGGPALGRRLKPWPEQASSCLYLNCSLVDGCEGKSISLLSVCRQHDIQYLRAVVGEALKLANPSEELWGSALCRRLQGCYTRKATVPGWVFLPL
jgi:hypothetical protein